MSKDQEKYTFVLQRLMNDPAFLIEMFWGLKPQPIKPEHLETVLELLKQNHESWEAAKKLFKPEYFEPFEKGKHITWQQWIILVSIRKARLGLASKRIGVASGHGIGKSAIVSWIILWFLFCFKDSQVPCTAPTADQMYDVLWKELNLWISRIKDPAIRDSFIWESKHIRMAYNPQVWFARAKTSSKNNSEALAGVHADHVLLVADEASGVEQQIFEVAESALTNENTMVLFISNPTRDSGYFYDIHHKYAKRWNLHQFDSEQSPIVDHAFVKEKEEKHGRDSLEFKIRVKGQFPDTGVMDDSGYIRLLQDYDIRTEPLVGNIEFVGTPILGVDPSGEGDDETPFYIRDAHKVYLVATEKKSTAKSIASKILTLKDKYDIEWSDIIVENFGVGADVGKEVALMTKGQGNITTVSTGEMCDDEDEKAMFLNKRAQYYWYTREWFIKGGTLIEDKVTKDQLSAVRFKRAVNGKIQIIPKLELRKRYGQDSPDRADSIMLTFARDVLIKSKNKSFGKDINTEEVDLYTNY